MMRGLLMLLLFSSAAAAQSPACVPPPSESGYSEKSCYIYVRPGMVFGNDTVLDRGGFYLREEADGAWRQVPMFQSEGVDGENPTALAEQDRLFGPRW